MTGKTAVPEARASDDASCMWAEDSYHRLHIPRTAIPSCLGAKEPIISCLLPALAWGKETMAPDPFVLFLVPRAA